MKIHLESTRRGKPTHAALIVGVYEGSHLTPAAKQLNKSSKGYLTRLIKQGVFEGKQGQILPLFHLPGNVSHPVFLVGCGKENSLNPQGYRKLIIAVVKSLLNAKVKRALSCLSEVQVKGKSLPWKIRHHAEAAMEAVYRFDQFMSKKESTPSLKELTLRLSNIKETKACESTLRQALAIAVGVALTKHLANMPSNICTPAYLAEQAKQLAKAHRLVTAKVLDEKAMKKLGMGALLAVAKGSTEKPRLICLKYQGAAKTKAPVALVGKGVTFDTGGNSLKPADSMMGMKYDMCGAATVLGTIKAAAELKLPVNIVGIIPSVENMPGGAAYKPEDIVTSLSGQTIEVNNTDAEGRLILCDALTYCERFQPDVVIDIATLTGAVVVALGLHATGLLANDEPLAQALLKAGEESHDRAWQLPLWDEYQEQIKSPFADMANTGGRSAGTITAACFLSRFTKKFRWAHLDVAGTAAMMAGTSERMATGRPVPLLVQYLIDRKK